MVVYILTSVRDRFYSTNFTLVATSTGGGIAYMNGTVSMFLAQVVPDV